MPRRPCPKMVRGIAKIPDSMWARIKGRFYELIGTEQKYTDDILARKVDDFSLSDSPNLPYTIKKDAQGRIQLTEAEKAVSYNPLNNFNSPSEILPTMYDTVVGGWRQMELSRGRAFSLVEQALLGMSKTQIEATLNALRQGRSLPRGGRGEQIKKVLDKVSYETRGGVSVGQSLDDIALSMTNKGQKVKLSTVLQRYISNRLSHRYLNEPIKLLEELKQQLPMQKGLKVGMNKREWASSWIEGIKGYQNSAGGLDGVIEKFMVQGRVPGTRIAIGGVSRGYIGLSMGTALKNVTQQMNDVIRGGFMEWAKSSKEVIKEIRLEGWKGAKQKYKGKGAIQAAERLFDIQQGGTRWQHMMDNVLFTPINLAESYNRMVSFTMGSRRAKVLGLNSADSIHYALDWVRKNHFELSHIDRAPMLTSGSIGRMGSVLMSFQIKQLLGTGGRETRELLKGFAESRKLLKGVSEGKTIIWRGKKVNLTGGAKDSRLALYSAAMPALRFSAIMGAVTWLFNPHSPVDFSFMFDFIPGYRGGKMDLSVEGLANYSMNPATAFFGDMAAALKGDERSAIRAQRALATVLLPAYATVHRAIETAPGLMTSVLSGEPAIVTEADRRSFIEVINRFRKGLYKDMPVDDPADRKIYDKFTTTEAMVRFFRFTPSRETRKQAFYEQIRSIRSDMSDKARIDVTPEDMKSHYRSIGELRSRGARRKEDRVAIERSYWAIPSKYRPKLTRLVLDALNPRH